MQPRRAALVAAVAATVLAGCSSTENGSGTTDRSSVPSGTPSPTVPLGVSAGPTSTLPSDGGPSDAGPSAPSASSGVPAGTPLTFTGSATGNTYRATVYDTDDIDNCAEHAFGQRMVVFLTQNPCRGAHRVLATVVLEGRTVAISVISTSFRSPDPSNPFAVAAKFKALEEASCGCGMKDLLREGGVLPGVSGGIPEHEAFTVLGQDSGATVLDAWYVGGTTSDQAPALVALERDVFLSALAGA